MEQSTKRCFTFESRGGTYTRNEYTYNVCTVYVYVCTLCILRTRCTVIIIHDSAIIIHTTGPRDKSTPAAMAAAADGTRVHWYKNTTPAAENPGFCEYAPKTLAANEWIIFVLYYYHGFTVVWRRRWFYISRDLSPSKRYCARVRRVLLSLLLFFIRLVFLFFIVIVIVSIVDTTWRTCDNTVRIVAIMNRAHPVRDRAYGPAWYAFESVFYDHKTYIIIFI